MKYAILGPQKTVNRVAATLPSQLPENVEAVEITDEQATHIADGRSSSPPVLYCIVDGQLLTQLERQEAERVKRQAVAAVARQEAEAAREAARLEAEMAREASLAATMSAPAYALHLAERKGIEVPLGSGTVRLACGDRDRALFSSALILYRTYEDELPSEEAKQAFRDSPVVFADVTGTPHQLTVSQARQLIVYYGSAYAALWTAATSAKA